MKLVLLVTALTLSLSTDCLGAHRPQEAARRDWAMNGGEANNTHYSPLAQINRENVAQLTVAWAYDTGETGGLQTSPIVVDGVLYGLSPSQKVFAVDAATGKVVWNFDSGIQGTQPVRGLAYWASADGSDRRIIVGVMNFVYALNAADGETDRDVWGRMGAIDLREGLSRKDPDPFVSLTSPVVIYKDTFHRGRAELETLPAAAGRRARVRCAHRKNALGVSHDSAARRIWL